MFEFNIKESNPHFVITRLILFIKTRWNSCFFMLSRLNCLKNEVIKLFGETEVMKAYKINPLTTQEWDQIKLLCEILEMFFLESVELECSKKSTINYTTCSYMFLYSHCSSMKAITEGNELFCCIRKGLIRCQDILNKYFNKGSLFCFAAMLLDPRVKATKYIERGWRSDAEALNIEYSFT